MSKAKTLMRTALADKLEEAGLPPRRGSSREARRRGRRAA